MSRQQGSAASNSTVAVVGDTESGAGAVTVTVTSANPSNGVTVSNIVNTDGTVTADITANCAAANASFTLRASDGTLTADATLNVGATADTPPSMTANPSSVSANSIGNTASTSAVGTSFQWAISNGLITSAANASSVTYSAGSSGSVTLTLTVVNSNNCSSSNSMVVPVTGTPPTLAAGSILISEFRARGETGADDEFVELYNNSDAAVNIGGVTIRVKEGGGSAAAPATLITLPAGATIPARGHYLLRKAGANNYSLASYAEADQTYAGAIGDGDGLAVFSSPTTFDAATLLDAVGFESVTDALYKEDAGLAPAAGISTDGQHSFVRRVSATGLRDTANNNTDFVFVSNTGDTFSGRVSILGAPGPENILSQISRTTRFGVQLVEPNVVSSAAPNRVRNITPTGLIELPNVGTLELRRRWINNTGQTVTSLRFRIVDVTTKNSAVIFGTQADLRAVSSTDFALTTSRGALTVNGLTLQSPSNQGTPGGGQNSSLTAALPPGGLAPGAVINVNFLIGVKTSGSFRFDIFIEALP